MPVKNKCIHLLHVYVAVCCYHDMTLTNLMYHVCEHGLIINYYFQVVSQFSLRQHV